MQTKSLKSTVPAVFLGVALAMPAGAHAALQLVGEQLEIYSRINLSFDFADNDSPAPGSNFSVSSNRSMIGFRGQQALDPEITLLWQLEQEFRPDAASGSLATRNTFLGVRTDNGTALVGYHDTPFKAMGKDWAVLKYTVADHRAILGASAADGDVMNLRARNSIHYMNTFEGVKVHGMYSTDGQDSSAGGLDDNDNQVFSIAAKYPLGALELSAALERWSNLSTPSGAGRATGLRMAATHRVGPTGRIGVLFESIDTAGPAMAPLDRNAFGINGSHRDGALTYEAQLLFVGAHRGLGSSGAVNVGVGVTRAINQQLDVYGAFSMTNNDDNALYQAADGGHGDEVAPTVGGATPYAVSTGVVFRF